MSRFSFLIISLLFSCITFSCGENGKQTPVKDVNSSTQSNTHASDVTPERIKSKKETQELSELRDQLTENPTDYSIAFQLIQRYESFEMIDEAILVLDEFIEISTDATRDIARMDRALINSRYNDKLFAYQEFLDLAENGSEENRAEVYFQLGNLLALEKYDPPEGDRIKLAVEYYTIASKLESGNALLYKRLADLMYSIGKLDDAREYLAIFLVVYPDDWQSLIDLAEWSIEAEDFEKARKYLDRSLKSNNEEIIKKANKLLVSLNNR